MKINNSAYLTVVLTLFLLISCHAQSTKKKKNNNMKDTTTDSSILDVTKDTITAESYLLGQYLISPKTKTVSVYQMTGGTEYGSNGEVMHWDGFKYEPDPKIKYATTSLIILGNQIVFKEYFDVDCDLSTLKVIFYNINNFRTVVLRDKSNLYLYYVGQQRKSKNPNSNYRGKDEIDISKYKVINDFVYQDEKGRLYLLSASSDDFDLKEIVGSINLDLSTLIPLASNYFCDKNGLYWLGFHRIIDENRSASYSGESVMLEENKGTPPIVTANYIIYNQSVYALHNNDREIRKLPLDVNKMKEVETNGYSGCYLLSDGKNTFGKSRTMGYSSQTFYTEYFDRSYRSDIFRKGFDNWKIITQGLTNIFKDKDRKTLYIPSIEKPFSGLVENLMIIKAPDGFYSCYSSYDGGAAEAVKADKVFIRNFDTKAYEELDASQYRYINEILYVYKGRVYTFFDSRPVKEYIDGEHLEFITYKGAKTNYLCDGKSLIYIGNMTGYSFEKVNGDEVIIFGKRRRIIHGVDFSTLKVIDENILVDKNHIYNGNYDGIGVIPIDKLGLDVKIFTE